MSHSHLECRSVQVSDGEFTSLGSVLRSFSCCAVLGYSSFVVIVTLVLVFFFFYICRFLYSVFNGNSNTSFPFLLGNQWSFINNNLHTQSLTRSSKGSSSLDRLYSRKIRKQLVHHKQVIVTTFFILMFRNII